MDFYRITKIRLINFHNFTDETIEVRQGGHLFMLGDNGSGKTTVLDAIHFVLTGGRSLEFNAAARVTGARHSGGRTVQGIVMRYNLEAGGPLNPNGGVTYAALEVEGRHGRPTSLCVGVSTSSMDERYESWGVIRECPVADLPLLQSEAGRQRVTTKSELRAALGATHYYGQIGAYCDELARRFFSDRETFDDVCKFLATGKAYREIASQTGDYHQLFRRLLQEPPRELFEEVIAHLKSLEESRQDLDKLRDQHTFVTSLSKLQTQVQTSRIESAAAQWQERHLAASEFKAAHDQGREHLAAEESRLLSLKDEQERLHNLLEVTRLRQEELRHQDAAGIVAAEREARLKLDEAQRLHNQSKRHLVTTQQRHQEAENLVATSRTALCQQVATLGRSLQRLGRLMPFSTSNLAAIFDDSQKSTTPEQELAAMPLASLHDESDAEAQQLDRSQHELESKLQQLEKRLATLTSEIDERRARGESIPLVKNFANAAQDIRQQLLHAQPLYLGLEPAAGTTTRELAALEQLIGDATLATWVTDPATADTLRALIFRNYPEQSLAIVDSETEMIEPRYSEWLRRYFDLTKSDPAAIMVLQHHLAARHGPHAEKYLEHHILRFRLREQVISSSPPRLIGIEMRRRELEREIRELEKQRQADEKQRKASAAELATLVEQRSNITSFKALLNEAATTISHLRDDVNRANIDHALALTNFEHARTECQTREEDYQRCRERHTDLQLALKQAGIEGLEARMQELDRKLKSYKKESDETLRESGRVESNITQLKSFCESTLAEHASALEQRLHAEEQLLNLVLPEIPLNEYVENICGTTAASRGELTERSASARERAAVVSQKIRDQVILPDGLAFGFVYDSTANTLNDRRGRTIAEVETGSSQALHEQEELINDQTIKLFRQLVMDNLVSQLQLSVIRLNEMARRIARLLRERSFGTNRYAFSITPLDHCKRLYDLVLNYRSLDPEQTATELRAFIEDHADEIKNTEVNEMPPILDYRNWFRYELKVQTTNDGIVMDRRVKSIGSGGEQAVPNYLLILTIAHFLYDKEKIRLPVLIFDEAFYGIDSGRRDQLLGFASDLELQLFVASPDQDGVKKEIPFSTSILVVKDSTYNVHLYPYYWSTAPQQSDLLDPNESADHSLTFGEEL